MTGGKRGTRLNAAQAADPWAGLAAGVLARAVDDALGVRMNGVSDGAKLQIKQEAERFLRSGAGGLLADFDIDPDSMGAALARIPRRRRRKSEVQ